MNRMHPDDLRALMAAHIYGQGLQLILGQQWQNVNNYAQTVRDADALLTELDRTAPKAEPGGVSISIPEGATYVQLFSGCDERPAGIYISEDEWQGIRARTTGAEARVLELETHVRNLAGRLAEAHGVVHHQAETIQHMEGHLAEAQAIANGAKRDRAVVLNNAEANEAQARWEGTLAERERIIALLSTNSYPSVEQGNAEAIRADLTPEVQP
jgi:hypothetical protein